MTYRRRLKFYLLKLFRLHDSPKAIAGGIAWGAFVHFYPTFGFGPLIAVGMARLFRTNMAAATVGWAVFMPLFPFFFYLNFLVGDLITGVPTENIWQAIQGISHICLKDILLLGKAFTLGFFVNSTLEVILFWWGGYILFKRYRKEALLLIRRIL
ncbi:MAG: DUF2062 domain-containing protein [Bacillota bacterium]|uniref:DUF2062 domain-containing protein n=1 Tax=Thermanaerosceptrum fracticalcis TaxID=1712410 RepID=A0A7G6E613_THEFR|nr:DUF2062 domain-containing protein [Thermanaerosceptrum fracticalcis]QNB47517.1 DUF2062 domain-containing protein [Thermanaerosceptrum fracticalcis]